MRVVLYFTAEWCNPCKKVRPIVEELNRDLAENKFIIVDADSELELLEKFSIKSVPTFIVLEDGKEVKRATGVQTREQLQDLIYND